MLAHQQIYNHETMCVCVSEACALNHTQTAFLSPSFPVSLSSVVSGIEGAAGSVIVEDMETRSSELSGGDGAGRGSVLVLRTASRPLGVPSWVIFKRLQVENHRGACAHATAERAVGPRRPQDLEASLHDVCGLLLCPW